jgi:putative membrane protein
MVLFWALIIVGIITLIRFNTGTIRAVTQPQPQSDDESPAKVLASRFARGEIEEPEYQQRLAVLRSTSRR